MFTVNRGHKHDISQGTEDLQETTDRPWFAKGVQDDENDVKMLFRACPLLKV